MEAYRLSKELFAGTFSGKGAAFKGARWDSLGVELIYTVSKRSLAMAEVAVHLTLATLPNDQVLVTIFIPDDIFTQKLIVSDLPASWNVFPPLAADQLISDRFITENNYCILQIPSAVTRGNHNLLINPNQIDFKKIKIIETQKFSFHKTIVR
jgi:RES domain-containing protein